MNRRWLGALILGLLAAGLTSTLYQVLSGRWWALAAGAALLLVVLIPFYGVRMLDQLLYAGRWWRWRREEGQHLAFEGIALHPQDDGRHCWLPATEVQRLLRRREPEDVLAARHASRWQRDASGRLLLRVDAVVTLLATGPGRMDPRTVRLRRYLERELLFPAERRHRASGGRGHGG
jgi:hypothetical protein